MHATRPLPSGGGFFVPNEKSLRGSQKVCVPKKVCGGLVCVPKSLRGTLKSFRPIAGYEDVLLYTTTNLVVSGIEAVMKCDTKEKMDERAKGLADRLSGDYNPPE